MLHDELVWSFDSIFGFSFFLVRSSLSCRYKVRIRAAMDGALAFTSRRIIGKNPKTWIEGLAMLKNLHHSRLSQQHKKVDGSQSCFENVDENHIVGHSVKKV